MLKQYGFVSTSAVSAVLTFGGGRFDRSLRLSFGWGPLGFPDAHVGAFRFVCRAGSFGLSWRHCEN
eukprot:2028781-Pyramimonas_sp.AAC.1